jgi:cytidylate kinase
MEEYQMKKYRVTLDVDTEHVKNFDMVIEADSVSEAESEALIEVKMNADDYISAYAEEEEEEEDK